MDIIYYAVGVGNPCFHLSLPRFVRLINVVLTSLAYNKPFSMLPGTDWLCIIHPLM